MGGRIRFESGAREARLDSPFWPGTGYVDLAVSGVIVAMAVLAVELAVEAMLGVVWPLASVAMAVVVGGVVVVWRQLAFERQERWLRRMQEAELERVRLELEMLRGAPGEEYVVMDAGAVERRLDSLARLMITRAFNGQGAERDTMTALGLCTQPEWNQVNGMFQEAGIRRGKRWVGDAVGALRTWEAWRRSRNMREVVMGGQRGLVSWGKPVR